MRDGPSGLALPQGFRDILPTEARELHAIERTLMTAFAQYGYVPLEPPTVELASSALTLDERRMLRFLDRDGRLLVEVVVAPARGSIHAGGDRMVVVGEQNAAAAERRGGVRRPGP